MPTAHALAAPRPGADLEPFTWEIGDPGPHGAIVEVEACGICHSDIHMIDDDWGMAEYPLVPGHEIVGTVVEVGEGVEHVEVGQRVGVGWQRSSCLDCPDCLGGDENLCDENEATIVGHHGGFADLVATDGRFAFPIPDELGSAEAAPLLCGGITVYSALREAGLGSGRHVGVIGLGGLGHLAVRFASALANDVTLFTSTSKKAAAARELGADAVVETADGLPDALDRPLDILVSTAPADLDWESYLALLGSDGVLSFVGVPPSGLVELPVFPLISKRRRVMGSPIGGRARIREMLDLCARLDLGSVVETFPLDEARTALDRLREGEVRFRAVLET